MLQLKFEIDVFVKLPRFFSVDHSFFFCVMYAAAPAEARQRHIINILCDFCGKSFPNSWVGHMSDIGREQKSLDP
jgi:hypothetical protein